MIAGAISSIIILSIILGVIVTVCRSKRRSAPSKQQSQEINRTILRDL